MKNLVDLTSGWEVYYSKFKAPMTLEECLKNAITEIGFNTKDPVEIITEHLKVFFANRVNCAQLKGLKPVDLFHMIFKLEMEK